jgi:hypothetical protein
MPGSEWTDTIGKADLGNGGSDYPGPVVIDLP